jgi:hypothetical protein
MVIVDIAGKGNRIRSVPMPLWAKSALDRWTTAVGLCIQQRDARSPSSTSARRRLQRRWCKQTCRFPMEWSPGTVRSLRMEAGWLCGERLAEAGHNSICAHKNLRIFFRFLGNAEMWINCGLTR